MEGVRWQYEENVNGIWREGGKFKEWNKIIEFYKHPIKFIISIFFLLFSLLLLFHVKIRLREKTDTELQFWPHLSREIYFSKPFVDVAQINKNKNLVSCPPDSSIDYLRRHGIMYAAVASHKKGYYQLRGGVDFHVVLYTVGGSAVLTYDGKKKRLSKGDMFIAPAGVSYSLSCAHGNWNLFWFHLENSPMWIDLVGERAFCKKSEVLDKFSTVVEFFLDDLYSPNTAVGLLDLYGDIMAEYLRKDLLGEADSMVFAEFEKWIVKIKSDLSVKWNAPMLARKIGVTAREINSICMRKYSKSFSKYLHQCRMLLGKELWLTGRYSLAKIAAKTGYSDAYAFSKAFKAYFGYSPRKLGGA